MARVLIVGQTEGINVDGIAKLMDDGRPPAMAGCDDGREKRMIEKTIIDYGFKTVNPSRVIPLKRDRQHHGSIDWLDIPDDIASLPDLQGYGNTYDLHQAMVRDILHKLIIGRRINNEF